MLGKLAHFLNGLGNDQLDPSLCEPNRSTHTVFLFPFLFLPSRLRTRPNQNAHIYSSVNSKILAYHTKPNQNAQPRTSFNGEKKEKEKTHQKKKKKRDTKTKTKEEEDEL